MTISWGGKAAGLFWGSVLGGPLGAVIGTAVGHALDRVAERRDKRQTSPPPSSPDVSAQVGFLYAVAVFLGHVAKADGQVDARERELILGIIIQLSAEIEASVASGAIAKLVRYAIHTGEGVPDLLLHARKNEHFRRCLLRYA